jgi:NAD(P)-dependent dehydrogenase (short-subunit alcohol dehydrogenase family)
MAQTALIVGAGSGLSASLARLLAKEGFNVAVAARRTEKISSLGFALKCDATDAGQVEETFKAVQAKWGVPDLVVYNASFRTRGPFADLKADDVWKTIETTAFAGFLVAQAAAKRMLKRGSGAIFLTGASASVKGYAQSAPFAMGKFALRGLAQSMARELSPLNLHVAHFVIDGRIGTEGDAQLHPDEIARNYLHVYRQQRSAWSWELELRPWVEKF